MKITTTVQLETGDPTPAFTLDEGAARVLTALDGDEQRDSSVFYLVAPSEPGQAGAPGGGPPAVEVQPAEPE